MKRRNGIVWIGSASALSLMTSSAMGAFTTVNPPAPGEDSHREILSQVYGAFGGEFTADGVNFTNGTLTAERIDDDFDQVWADLNFTARGLASFADFSQTFGYLPGSSGGDFVELFELGGDEYAVSGEVSTTIDGEFRFARNGNRGILASSNPDDNPGDNDHVVTYLLTGEGVSGSIWVLFFEDRRNFDFDYQDLVVEVREAGAFIIPTPAAFAAGLAMMGVAAVRRRRA